MIAKTIALVGVAALCLTIGCSPQTSNATAPAEPVAAPPPVQSGALENGSFTAELNGFSIHYEVHGQGPVVMTLPNSWGLSLGGLRALYRSLEDTLTIVYFDPRGMGESAPIKEESDMSMAAVRADFDALRRHLGLEKVNALGWSNGATNLILLASEKPDTLSTAVFLHGSARYGPEDMRLFAEKYPELLGTYAAFLEGMKDGSLSDEEKTARQRAMWLGEFFPTMFADREAGKVKLQQMYEGVGFSWAHAAYSEQETPSFDFTAELAAIRARCLVVAGAEDMMPPEKVKQLHEGLADSEYVLFDDSGHFAPVEEPAKFKKTLYAFLKIS